MAREQRAGYNPAARHANYSPPPAFSAAVSSAVSSTWGAHIQATWGNPSPTVPGYVEPEQPAAGPSTTGPYSPEGRYYPWEPPYATSPSQVEPSDWPTRGSIWVPPTGYESRPPRSEEETAAINALDLQLEAAIQEIEQGEIQSAGSGIGEESSRPSTEHESAEEQ